MTEPCPSTEECLRLETDPVLQERFLEHATQCPKCLVFLEMAQDEEEGTSARTRSLIKKWLWAASAAGVLLAAEGTTLLWRTSPSQSPSPEPYTLPLGEPVPIQAGEFTAGPEVARHLSLPDGTRVCLEPGSRIGFSPIQSGERAHLQLLAGALEAEVSPGKGAFRIGCEAGKVEVLGTHLWMKSFSLRGLDSRVSCLCVEVFSGKVQIQGSPGNLTLLSNERGLLVGNRVLEKQEMGGDWTGPFEAFTRLLQPAPTGFRIDPTRRERAEQLAALLVGSRWKTSWDPPDPRGDSSLAQEAKRILRRIEQ